MLFILFSCAESICFCLLYINKKDFFVMLGSVGGEGGLSVGLDSPSPLFGKITPELFLEVFRSAHTFSTDNFSMIEN